MYPNMFGLLHRPNRAGKTFESLKWLSEAGGGTYVTSVPSQAYSIIEQCGYTNIEVVDVKRKSIVIDDADAHDVLVTHTLPLALGSFQIESYRNPYLPDLFKSE